MDNIIFKVSPLNSFHLNYCTLRYHLKMFLILSNIYISKVYVISNSHLKNFNILHSLAHI